MSDSKLKTSETIIFSTAPSVLPIAVSIPDSVGVKVKIGTRLLDRISGVHIVLPYKDELVGLSAGQGKAESRHGLSVGD
jgi:hypothetical protein